MYFHYRILYRTSRSRLYCTDVLYLTVVTEYEQIAPVTSGQNPSAAETLGEEVVAESDALLVDHPETATPGFEATPAADPMLVLNEELARTGDPEKLWQILAGYRDGLIGFARTALAGSAAHSVTSPEDVVHEALERTARAFIDRIAEIRAEDAQASGEAQEDAVRPASPYPRLERTYLLRTIKRVVADQAKRRSTVRDMLTPQMMVLDYVVDPTHPYRSDLGVRSAEIEALREADRLQRQRLLALILEGSRGKTGDAVEAWLNNQLRPSVKGDPRPTTEQIAAEFDMSPQALRAAVARLRQRAHRLRAAGALVIPEETIYD